MLISPCSIIPREQSGISRSEFFVTTKVYRGFDDLKGLEASVDDSNKALGLGQSIVCALDRSSQGLLTDFLY